MAFSPLVIYLPNTIVWILRESLDLLDTIQSYESIELIACYMGEHLKLRRSVLNNYFRLSLILLAKGNPDSRGMQQKD